MKHIMAVMMSLAIILTYECAVCDTSAAEKKGTHVALAMDRADSGYGDYRANVLMTLRDRKGRKSQRSMNYLTLEMPDDGDKSMVIFMQPPDIKGVAALTFSHKTQNDDQWLYLPDLRRVKRVATSNQAGPFVGSEFAYEDIGTQEPEKYTYRYLKKDSHEGRDCDLIERFPVNPDSGYSKQIVWVEIERNIPWRVDYYDRKGDLLKTLTYHDYVLYVKKFWRATRSEMVNHQVGKATIIEYSNYKFANNLTETDLSINALKRAR